MVKLNNKIIVILGPTSSGKSDVAIKLARKFNGEIISADSRQIYRGMDIGTGKIYGTWNMKHKTFISEGIPHYGIDIVSPKTNYSAAKFKKYADKIIADILKRGKVPIICGGTGFWIKALVDDVIYPEVAPDWELRNKLRNYSKEKLFSMLRKLDPVRAKSIDKNNPVRLIRAIEICKTLGCVPSPQPSPDYGRGGSNSHPSLPLGEMSRTRDREGANSKYQFIQIGIKIPKEKLHQNIKKRLIKRFEIGMIEEVKKLHFENKISWKKLKSFGLGYKIISECLRKEVYPVKFERSETGEALFNRELFEKVLQAEKDYAKRQMTWFSKDARIIWLEKYSDIKNKVNIFLKS